MTRLALAKTLVYGTVTLQGNSHTFTASGSGTGTADRVSDAKKLAITAANSAAIIAARASIDKILTDNSSVLADLEITSLISNNLSTTVIVFRPLALSKIATTTDDIKYYLKQNVTIKADQWITVPSGKTLHGAVGNKLRNHGFLQLGDGSKTRSKDSTCSTDCSLCDTDNSCCSSFEVENNESIAVSSGECLKVDSKCTNNNSIDVNIGGTLIICSGGVMTNNSEIDVNGNLIICSGGVMTINSGGLMTNNSEIDVYGTVTINSGGTINNTGTVTINSGGLMTNNSKIDVYGTVTIISGGTINNNSKIAVYGTVTISSGGGINNNVENVLHGVPNFYVYGVLDVLGSFINYADVNVQGGGTVEIYLGGAMTNYLFIYINVGENGANGVLTTDSGGEITNKQFATISIAGIFTNDGTYDNEGQGSWLITRPLAGQIVNNGVINNKGQGSYSCKTTGTGSCNATGENSKCGVTCTYA